MYVCTHVCTHIPIYAYIYFIAYRTDDLHACAFLCAALY